MKKLIIILSAVVGLSVSSFAQTAVESNIEIKKITTPCVMATYNFSQDLLDETIKKRFSDLNASSPDKSKGFKIYRSVSLPEISADRLDVFIKTDGKKQTSICYIALSRGNDNFMNPQSDSQAYTKLKNWMNNLNDNAGAIQLQHEIDDQKDNTAKMEKKYNSSVSDGKGLEKEIENLKKKIEDNKAEQAKKLKDWDDAKAKLEELNKRVKK
jgi:peptidoglycan hydrolase CwlO-like protein